MNELIKWIILILILALCLISAYFQIKQGKLIVGVISLLIFTLVSGFITTYLYEIFKPFVPFPSGSDIVISTDTGNTKADNVYQLTEPSQLDDSRGNASSQSVAEEEIQTSSVDSSVDDEEPDSAVVNSEIIAPPIDGVPETQEETSTDAYIESTWVVPEEENEPILSKENETVFESSESESYSTYMEDITGCNSVSGKLIERGQKNNYQFTSQVEGTYRFDADVSAGVEVRIRVSGENGKTLNYSDNGLTIDLEAGKTYVLSVEYRNGACDYTISIGIPIVVSDITGTTSILGNITYRDQKDRYLYTAPVSGTYHFDTDLSAGGEVRIRISGENGRSLSYNDNGLSYDLEANKTYILSVEYRKAPCDYKVSIGVPLAINDITGNTVVSGSITYRDQKDRYRYTASISGTYRFDADLSAGGNIRIRISGENDRTISYNDNGLTIELEAEKTYIISIEYRNGICDYTLSIGVPKPIEDITGYTFISGDIVYRDQNDRYLYTAFVDGIYYFKTDLSSGGKVRIRIRGENGNSLKQGDDELRAVLEEGKTYILSVEYRNELCSYGLTIDVPN